MAINLELTYSQLSTYIASYFIRRLKFHISLIYRNHKNRVSKLTHVASKLAMCFIFELLALIVN